jgi:hypothetical protein
MWYSVALFFCVLLISSSMSAILHCKPSTPSTLNTYFTPSWLPQLGKSSVRTHSRVCLRCRQALPTLHEQPTGHAAGIHAPGAQKTGNPSPGENLGCNKFTNFLRWACSPPMSCTLCTPWVVVTGIALGSMDAFNSMSFTFTRTVKRVSVGSSGDTALLDSTSRGCKYLRTAPFLDPHVTPHSPAINGWC